MSVAGPQLNVPASASLDSSSLSELLVELDDPEALEPLLVELDDPEALEPLLVALDDPELDALELDPLEVD